MRKSSYQKLKEENARLKREISVLIQKPESIEGLSLKAGYEMRYGFEKSILFGNWIDYELTKQKEDHLYAIKSEKDRYVREALEKNGYHIGSDIEFLNFLKEHGRINVYPDKKNELVVDNKVICSWYDIMTTTFEPIPNGMKATLTYGKPNNTI